MLPATQARALLLATNYSSDEEFEQSFKIFLDKAIKADLNFAEVPLRPSPEMMKRLTSLGYIFQYDYKTKTTYIFFA